MQSTKSILWLTVLATLAVFTNGCLESGVTCTGKLIKIKGATTTVCGDSSECSTICSEYEACVAWTYNVNNKKCSIYSTRTGTKKNSKYLTGARDCAGDAESNTPAPTLAPTPEPTECAPWSYGQFIGSGDEFVLSVKGIAEPEDCEALCAAETDFTCVCWSHHRNGASKNRICELYESRPKFVPQKMSSKWTSGPFGCPTPAPTHFPTNFPTVHPTAYPTDYPTAFPTAEPTQFPTAFPTAEPTEFPTAFPTAEPTEFPTAFPTAEPTQFPTAFPTAEPTEFPTAFPTAEPTQFPTAFPTAEPTQFPTAFPTAEPTEFPTAFPTAEPTEFPTAFPTAEPTQFPTAFPTAKPTEFPTAFPTAEPTQFPTAFPTAEPTEFPTAFPTAEPTQFPTAFPTAEPTEFPTAFPTAEPTQFPTAFPTAEPTEFPTAFPTADPTAFPTAFPTAEPTAFPTAFPTAEPTAFPTAFPTAEPTAFPTAFPTAEPTQFPTAFPTAEPTAYPTLSPVTIEELTPAPTQAPIYQCPDRKLDIMWIMDNSQSISTTGSQTLQSLLPRLAEAYTLSSADTRFSGLAYSTQISGVSTTINSSYPLGSNPFNSEQNISPFNFAMDQSVNTNGKWDDFGAAMIASGKTNTPQALQAAKYIMGLTYDEGGPRSDDDEIIKIVILFTDGNPNLRTGVTCGNINDSTKNADTSKYFMACTEWLVYELITEYKVYFIDVQIGSDIDSNFLNYCINLPTANGSQPLPIQSIQATFDNIQETVDQIIQASCFSSSYAEPQSVSFKYTSTTECAKKITVS